MPPFAAYSHYLSYLATDQQTFVALRGTYDGIVVPGTIAAWQQQGTGGFVLSLSATEASPPYMIDPRFPLFQQRLASPKQSHQSLASLLGDPGLVVDTRPDPSEFPPDRLRAIARAWVSFNQGYQVSANEKFSKYAARLEEEIPSLSDVQPPEAILSPYFAADGPADPWWTLSKTLFAFARQESGALPCYPVVCAKDPHCLDALLLDLAEDRALVWVSGLDEPRAQPHDLTAYRVAVENAAQRGQELFALYGGFFSVLLGAAGLRGSAHGVGFSEHRDWRELPETGAPPARYYLRRAHRYVSQDLAELLHAQYPAFTQCPCPYCAARSPVALDYHDLMKHSVWCRAEEIREWAGVPLTSVSGELFSAYQTLSQELAAMALPPAIRLRAEQNLEHLPRWALALR